MAATAIGDAKDKKWVTVHAPAFQKDALDVVQVAALHAIVMADAGDGGSAPETARQALLDVVTLASDNAQRIARVQLDRVFEAANAKGALRRVTSFWLSGPTFSPAVVRHARPGRPKKASVLGKLLGRVKGPAGASRCVKT